MYAAPPKEKAQDSLGLFLHLRTEQIKKNKNNTSPTALQTNCKTLQRKTSDRELPPTHPPGTVEE
jgi:hypothetical protein